MKRKDYCANCEHCVVVREYEQDSKKYVLRVRCTKKRWAKRSGEEKRYKYFTVSRRVMTDCPDYSPMGPEDPFIKNLRRELPVKDQIYTAGENEYLGVG
ncbi:MAG: hypothetical protein D6767_03390 [Candidatus Hydrogenedentota bacterium]|nr:MAG: hypothetical protein D6767_03390 [Candidatus Hydrogenedentota bacterium]